MDRDKAENLRRTLNAWNRAVSELDKAKEELGTIKRIEKSNAKKKEVCIKRVNEAQQRLDKTQAEVSMLTN